MNTKTIKRILYGVVGAAFLVVGGQEVMSAGLNLQAVAGLGVGAIFGLMSLTGAG